MTLTLILECIDGCLFLQQNISSIFCMYCVAFELLIDILWWWLLPEKKHTLTFSPSSSYMSKLMTMRLYIQLALERYVRFSKKKKFNQLLLILYHWCWFSFYCGCLINRNFNDSSGVRGGGES